MKELNIELDHHDRAFGPGEELRYAVNELYETLQAGSVEIGTYDEKEISGKVETDNYVIEILPKDD